MRWTAKNLENYVFVLLVEVLDTETTRIVEVPPTFNLRKLHCVLQKIFAWEDNHMHEFRTGDGRRYVPWEEVDELKGLCFTADEASLVYDESRKKLFACLTEVDEFLEYEYDFGDGHEHKITLIDVAHRENFSYPRCTSAFGFRPFEDHNPRLYEPARTLEQITAELGRIR
jgi:hypothetical protein